MLQIGTGEELDSKLSLKLRQACCSELQLGLSFVPGAKAKQNVSIDQTA
jgi:hypothetical protein